MMNKTGLLMTLLAAAGLVGCGETTGEKVLGAVSYASELFSGGGLDGVSAGAVTTSAGFTPEAVTANPQNFQLFTINALGITELARKTADNGPSTTWISQSGFGVSFKDGIVVATRGLVGEDVMAGNAPGLRDALRAGGGTVNRAIETLDSLNQIQTATFVCAISHVGPETINLGVREQQADRFDENCRGSTVIFDNIYWLDDQGNIVASRQYVSPTVAYLRSNRL